VKIKELISLYKQDSLTNIAADYIQKNKPKIAIKGINGSLDAVLITALYELTDKNFVIIAQDREEAAYLHDDLENLFETYPILYFPQSYKKLYRYEEIENANVLQRTETLSAINAGERFVLVTFPEAISEKVIDKKTLIKSTLSVRRGEMLDVNFLREMLLTYNFEPTEFVYEPGQFAVRGGIIDVFSFSAENPFRIELFGDEVESIRVFDAETQLSIKNIEIAAILPNLEDKMSIETRISFIDFLPKNTVFWLQDTQDAFTKLKQNFQKAQDYYEQLVAEKSVSNLLTSPEQLFDSDITLEQQLNTFTVIEYGHKQYYKKESEVIDWNSKPQPSFNKKFELLAETLEKYQIQHYANVIAAEAPKQLEKLQTILEEITHFVKFQPLYIGLRQGFIDEHLKLLCFTDHQIFERYYRTKVREKASKSKSITLKELKALQIGDYVTHIDHGIGRFAGLEKVEVAGKLQEAIRLVYRDDDAVLVSIHALHKIAKYVGKETTTPPQMSKLGSQDWENKKARTRKKIQDIAKELITLYAKRKAAPGFAFSADSYLQMELEASFLYEDTPDQAKATQDVKADMEKPHPMDRLVCGDVGFGKTEVAVRAAFKAVNDSKQVAVLVPTTLLAMQHFRTFKERLDNLPCNVDYISRFKSTKQIKETLQKVAEGKVDILIGTHKLVGSEVKFKNLGLLIIDEEHKFGVKTKEKLKEMRVNIDVLALSATPIPRTLQFSLMNARDLSVIATPPPNRRPVTTEVVEYDEAFIRDAIREELNRNGQVFFVHNRISDIEAQANTILRLVPDAKIAVAHGQMESEKLEAIMLKFIEGEYDILVSTNIIESGIDIPNANTIIINRADMFGLADLHQMRGRVGRSNKKAFCYLLTRPSSKMTPEARRRLKTLEEFSDLGDGFNVAMRDLDIRGSGDIFGSEQSGFISDLGFDTYHRILDEAIQDLKENEFKELFATSLDTKKLVRDTVIETDLEIVIPDAYVSSITERLQLYTQLDNLKDETELAAFATSLEDRFGKAPQSVVELLQTVRLRWQAEQLGFEKITLKNGMMRCYFTSAENTTYFQSDVFGKILQFVQKYPQKCKLKDVKGKPMLIFDAVRSVAEAMEALIKINNA
jgi:transcription-repair coupling factor (superfamily II helicase)